MMRVTRDLVIVAVFVGLAAACSSSSSGSGAGGASGSDGGSQTSAEAGTPDGSTAGGDAGATDASSGDAASSDAASSGDASGTCSFVGTWTGISQGGAFPGSTVTIVFSAAGTYTGVIGAYSWGGNWTLVGNAFTLNDTSGSAPCPSAQVGGYDITFGADCNTADFAATSDQCAGRSGVMNGIHMTRM